MITRNLKAGISEWDILMLQQDLGTWEAQEWRWGINDSGFPELLPEVFPLPEGKPCCLCQLP